VDLEDYYRIKDAKKNQNLLGLIGVVKMADYVAREMRGF
jgi:hypothetical protein